MRGLSLVGRCFVSPLDLTRDEIKSLLWTAIDIRRRHQAGSLGLKPMPDRNIFHLSRQNDIKYLALSSAAHLLGANIDRMALAAWDERYNVQELRKIFENNNVHMLFCQPKKYNQLLQMTQQAKIPVILISCCRHNLVVTLATVMTLQQRFGYVKGLRVAWHGPPCGKMNSFMTILSQIGINVNFACSIAPDVAVSPMILPEVAAIPDHAPVEEHLNLVENFKDTNVIVLRPYVDCDFNLREEHVRAAAKDCVLIRDFPRGRAKLSPSLVGRDISWDCINNTQFVYAAIILRFLGDHEHKTPFPNFEGKDQINK